MFGEWWGGGGGGGETAWAFWFREGGERFPVLCINP